MTTVEPVSGADYYLKNISFNYLNEGGESPGQWSGLGAETLGLAGLLDGEHFQRVLAGYHPRQNKALVQMKRSSPPVVNPTDGANAVKVIAPPIAHRPGFDVTFLPPKSVSALWAVSNQLLRREIEQAFDLAVKATLEWLEREVHLTRRGQGGWRRELAKLVLASFDHVQNRNGEPLLHRHVVFCNVCQREDGTFGTLDSKTLHNWVRTLGPMFRANLAKNLRDDLGLELVAANGEERGGKAAGWFEIAGVPESLTKQWSSRRAEIVEAIEGQGTPIGQSSAKARSNATLTTRKAKDLAVPREQLHERWQKEAAQHGFTPEKAAQLVGQAREVPQSDLYAQAWAESLKELTHGEAHFTERLVIQKVCEKLQTGHLCGIDIADRVRHDLRYSPEIVPLQDQGADKQFTTKEMWDLEEKLLQQVDALKNRTGAQVSDKVVAKTLKQSSHLDEEQAAAVRRLLTSDSAIRTMTGVAGAGKSTTLDTVKDGFELAGYRVIGGALSGVAKEELAEKTGMSARTVESYLYHLDKTPEERLKERAKHEFRQIWRAATGKSTWKKESVSLDAKTVLVLDEASMLDTRSMQRLVQHVEKAGATLILVGDNKQLQPILAGMPMRGLVETTPNSHLTVNRRQLDIQDKAAVQAVREGNAAEAIKNYADRGRVTVGEDRRDTIEKLVETWTKEGGARRPEDIAVYVQTKKEAAEINRLCQEQRLKAARTPHLVFVKNGHERYFRGDRVMFHKPNRMYGGIENGHKATVISVDPIRSEIKVRLDRMPANPFGGKTPTNIVTIPVRKFGDAVSLGYASTTHKGQSQTVKNSLVLMGGPMTDQPLAYVQLTRAKKSTQIFVDKSHAGEDLKDLVAAIEKPRAKTMAHDHARRPSQGPELTHEHSHEPR
ncbi:Multifunctional conjugation protein TraI [Caulifigura coniformis]|uniref:Multifunctional conjugation protein TraI n=1 Tax=Caulifigura coniformis TaxID=2527983 RepID=A0A517S9L5_9PLAN|nr:MobF family relaxase [Caulifigura coniformis]QDT52803.1 Multifunctional conjugation protein TraI [Caulifigura coniformis]